MPGDNAPETAQDLENNPEHAKRASEVIRTFSDAELSQGIACPRAFIDRVPGFTALHAATKAAPAILVQLAEDEQRRRRDIEIRRQARMANYLAMGSLVVSIVAFAVSII